MNNFYKILIINLLFQSFCVLAYANDNAMTEGKILSEMELINKGDMANYLEKMIEIDNKFIEYVKSKTEQCSSAVDSFEVGAQGEQIVKKKKISHKEKNLCLSNLLKFKVKYTQLSFDGRKKHLRFRQEQQWKELIDFERNQIEQLRLLEKKYQ